MKLRRTMKKIWMLSVLLTVTPVLATAPSANYVQVQSTDANDGAAEKAGAAVDNAAAATGQAVDNAAAATGQAVDNAAAATGQAVDNAAAATGAAAQNAQDAVNNKVDPNHDGVVDTNNDGVADTRQIPWGLLGLFGLFGLLGTRRRDDRVVTTSGVGTATVDRR
jgi:MYXO-CTERM domain-containing protein